VTGELDPNDLGHLLREIDGELSPPRVGRVAAVYSHTGSESPPSNHEVDVAVPPGGEVDQQHRRVDVLQPAGGTVFVPREKDMALVFYRNGDDPIAICGVYGDKDPDRAPLGAEGDIRLRRGSLYTELAGDGTYARIAKKPGDLDAPTAEVAIDEQGNVTIQTDGDITVSAGGDVVIDEGGTAKSVLTEDAVFDYSGTTSDGAGYSGTTSTVSNNETTEAEIE